MCKYISFLLPAIISAFQPFPSGWYQGSIGNLLFVQANVRSRTQGDLVLLMNLPSLPVLPVHGWTLFDLHDGEFKMTDKKGVLQVEVLPEGVDSHPIGPQFMQVVGGLITNVFPMHAEYRRFSDQIEFKVGPFTVRLVKGFDPDFITRNLKEGEKVNRYQDRPNAN